MESRKFLFILASLAILASPLLAAPTNGLGYDGGTALVTRSAGYWQSGFDGGEFTLSGAGLLLSNSGYADFAKNALGIAGSFQTFCVETSEHAYVNKEQNLWVSTETYEGNTPGSHSWQTAKNLASGTAYLYTQFAKGILSDYEYTPGIDRATDAQSLQRAIWAFQGGLNPNTNQTFLNDLKAVAWYNEALNAVASGAWSGIGDVRILQGYVGDKETGEIRQDMLYIVPTPGAILLAGIGTGLIGWLRRRNTI